MDDQSRTDLGALSFLPSFFLSSFFFFCVPILPSLCFTSDGSTHMSARLCVLGSVENEVPALSKPGKARMHSPHQDSQMFPQCCPGNNSSTVCLTEQWSHLVLKKTHPVELCPFLSLSSQGNRSCEVPGFGPTVSV